MKGAPRTWTAALGWFFAAYALLTGIFIVLESRRPQATLAWMLLFLTLPGIGLVVYAPFGRDRKALGRQRKLAPEPAGHGGAHHGPAADAAG